jgi:hypothetical protein
MQINTSRNACVSFVVRTILDVCGFDDTRYFSILLDTSEAQRHRYKYASTKADDIILM